MPFVDRDLAGEDGRAAPIAFLEDFVEVTTGAGVEQFEALIVEDEELDAGETAQDARSRLSCRRLTNRVCHTNAGRDDTWCHQLHIRHPARPRKAWQEVGSDLIVA